MRDNILEVVTGKKKVGKTYKTTEHISQYISANPKTGKVGRKVLIFDVNFEYEQFRAIGLSDLKRFTLQQKVEVRRVLPLLKTGKVADSDQMEQIMNVMLRSFAGGLLILEDINNYMVGTESKKIISKITTNRHVDLDIIIHYQSLSAVSPRLFQNANVIRFHQQLDPIDRYEPKIPYFELLKIVQILVGNEYNRGNERFYCYVSADDKHATGQFAESAFKEACVQYAQQYPRKINLILQGTNKDKDKRDNAVSTVATELEKLYNGNKKRK